ncbi:MAG: hypothetical protein ACI32E_02425 [Bacilli bacterium]
MSKKSKKNTYVDDGHTIYNMDVDGMPHRRVKPKNDGLDLTKKERKAIIKAALAHYLPILLGVIGSFFLTMILIYLWLK